MESVFAPGCALLMYKPHLAEKLNTILSENLGQMDDLLTCCKHEPQVDEVTEVINICPGCDKRYSNDYTHPGTWEPDQWHQELDEFIRVH